MIYAPCLLWYQPKESVNISHNPNLSNWGIWIQFKYGIRVCVCSTWSFVCSPLLHVDVRSWMWLWQQSRSPRFGIYFIVHRYRECARKQNFKVDCVCLEHQLRALTIFWAPCACKVRCGAGTLSPHYICTKLTYNNTHTHIYALDIVGPGFAIDDDDDDAQRCHQQQHLHHTVRAKWYFVGFSEAHLCRAPNSRTFLHIYTYQHTHTHRRTMAKCVSVCVCVFVFTVPHWCGLYMLSVYVHCVLGRNNSHTFGDCVPTWRAPIRIGLIWRSRHSTRFIVVRFSVRSNCAIDLKL